MNAHIPRRTARGFTLVEMLVVLGIIAILSGLVLTALGAARKQARIRETEATLKIIEAALEQYQADFQDYPPSENDPDGIKGAESLYKCLNTDKKEGPYIKSTELKVCDSNKNDHLEFADAFMRPIRYFHHHDYNSKAPNKRTYRLISAGPDGNYDEGRRESDDIVNWNKARPDQ
ncbi:MAG TPA: prepilin-type N-terminal cleavage/methylation domain-containing protein [Planctomycetota bacterium]|jgi:type II secretion system protein G